MDLNNREDAIGCGCGVLLGILTWIVLIGIAFIAVLIYNRINVS